MKVVCLRDEVSEIDGDPNHPDIKDGSGVIEGNIYTVMDAKMSTMFKSNFPIYRFLEIPYTEDGLENWYEASAFAPLETYKEKELQELKTELNL